MTNFSDIKAAKQLSDTLAMSDNRDGRMLSNDLRIRVLDGFDPEPSEMLLIVNEIRQHRRSAARAVSAGSTASRRKAQTAEVPMTVENLRAILDEEV